MDDPQRFPAATQVDASDARTQLGDLALPTRDPNPAGLTTAGPAPGLIARLDGPFDDRFEWRRLRLAGGAVTGSVQATSDVSDSSSCRGPHASPWAAAV